MLPLKSILKELPFLLKIIGIAILIAICLRIFFFASFKIPSPSMEPAVVPGDFVLVNKLAIGPRVYKNFKFMKGAKVETKRLWGFDRVKRNDVLVFNFPYTDWHKLGFDLNVFYVKRCIAIPGDTFYIDNGIYKVRNCPDTLGYFPVQLRLSEKRIEDFDSGIWNCFPYDNEYNWNIKNFGPLYIPRKNETLEINVHNIKLYRNLIRYETDKEIQTSGDSVFLGNEIIHSYTFKQNYYFMSGDYIFDSRDSRYWGLLPEDHIVGKVAFIWQSKDPDTGKFRWNRFFKSVL